MRQAHMHTAIFEGTEYTLSQSAWGRLSGRSRNFLVKMMQEAEQKGIPEDKHMQYALEQTPNDPARYGRKRTSPAVLHDSMRKHKEDRAMSKNKKAINMFLLARR